MRLGSLEEGQHGGVGGVLLVDFLGGRGAGGRVQRDAGGNPPTQVRQEVHQDSPGGGDVGALLYPRLGEVWGGTEGAMEDSDTHSEATHVGLPQAVDSFYT